MIGLDLVVRELQVPVDGACETKIPWLQLVSAFVFKYPQVVKWAGDSLVRVLAGLMQSIRSMVLEVCRGLLVTDGG